jgi:glycosyltransferase involved in cell wall biosynthesis
MVDVVMPVLDEAAALPWLLDRMPPGYRAIVADNGSTDGSATIAARLGAVVVQEPRRGFGAACLAGLRAARSDVVCFMDADASLDPADLPVVAGPLLADEADLVLGARRADPSAWPPHARALNRLLALELRRRGLPLTDLGPTRAARRAALLDLAVADRGSAWPLEMVLRAQASGWRVSERPVPYHVRRGRSKVTGTMRGTLRAVRDMGVALALGGRRDGAPRLPERSAP